MNTAISTVSGKQKHNYQMQQELMYKCISGSVKRKAAAGHGQHRDFLFLCGGFRREISISAVIVREIRYVA